MSEEKIETQVEETAEVVEAEATEEVEKPKNNKKK